MKKLFRGLLTLALVSVNSYGWIHAQLLDKPVDEMFQLRNHLEKVYAVNPQQRLLEQQAQAQLSQSFVNYSQRLAQSLILLKGNTRLIIPVVIHNIYEAQSMDGYVNDDRVQEAIQMLNADYNLNNAFRESIVDPFKALESDAGIEFRLAQIDPEGNYTTGVTRHQSWFTYNGSWEHPEVKRICSWPRDQYLNIWVVYSSDGSSGSAWAYLPSQVANESGYEDLDGVVISEWAFGKKTPGYYSILTHEIGHYLGLEHTWGEAELGSSGACDTDDGIDDTPACKGFGGECDPYYSTCGTLDNVQNFMDYSQCSSMFTQGQVTYMRNTLSQSVSDRNQLCTLENYQQTFIFDEPRITYDTQKFKESLVNDGSILEPVQLGLHNIEFALTGRLVEGIHYALANVPEGLTVAITVKNTRSAQIELTGQAQVHLETNSIENLAIIFKAATFSSDFDRLMNPAQSFAIQFSDLVGIVYHPYDGVEVPTYDDKLWSWFVVPDFSMDYNAFIDKDQDNNLMLDTYQKPVVCNAGTRNISLLQKGTVVGPGSGWDPAGEYPDLHVLNSADYTVWQGQTAYVGIQLWKSDNTGEIHHFYGYLELKVNAEGTAYEVLGVAYNPVSGEPIVTGVAASELMLDQADWYEHDDNDGSIITSGSLRLLSDQFTVGKGTYLEEGTHYTLTNLPEGLTFLVYIDDVNNARIYISGQATEHESLHSCEVGVAFTDAVFQGGNAQLVGHSTLDLSLHFRDEYQIVYDDVEDFTVSQQSPWKLFNLGYRNASFGVWFDNEALTTRFELYEDEGVSFEGGRNLVPLEEGTVIHGGMNWVAGGNFPNEHNISTPDFTVWNGKEGFVGMRFASGDHYFYGWVHIQVAADGNSYAILDYAFNENMDQPILAGRQQVTAVMTLVDNVFVESKTNDGSFNEELDGELFFCELAKANGDLKEGVDFVVNGLPDGLTMQISATDSRHFKVGLSGQMTQHERSNNAVLEILFQDAAFAEGNQANVVGRLQPLEVQCWDALDMSYVNNLDERVDALNTWHPFYMHGIQYGIFYMDYEEETTLRFETYQQRMVCKNGTVQVKPLEKGTLIDQSSTWVAGGDYPDLHVVYSSDFTDWAGQIAYAGIEVAATDGIYYGWLRFHVSADGSSYELLDYAIQNIPGQAITAGEVAQSIILPSKDRICDDAASKQVFESVIDLELNGEATFSAGPFHAGEHYILTGMPNDLNVVFKSLGDQHCQLVIFGDTRDYMHDQVIDLKLAFTNEAFTAHDAAVITGAVIPLQLTFDDPYEINTKSYMDFSVSENFTWEDFYFMDNSRGGLWFDSDTRSLFLEVYDNQVVCQPGTQNILLLAEGTPIGPDLTWESQGADFPGQHLAYGAGYTDLARQEGYAGIRVLQEGKWHYGWVQLSINETGTRLMTTGYGMCLRPETTIPAGHNSLAHFSADKSMVQPGELITFSDQSLTPADEWIWYFEGADQTTSTKQNPQMTYSANGVYRVMLTVNSIEVKGASVVYEDYVFVDQSTATNDQLASENLGFQIYPNPAQNLVNVILTDTQTTATIRLHNLKGGLIQEWELMHIQNPNTLQLQHVPTGLYLLEVIQGAHKKGTRLIVN